MKIIECREENGQGERKKRAQITESKVLLASMTFAHVRKLSGAKNKTETDKTQRNHKTRIMEINTIQNQETKS